MSSKTLELSILLSDDQDNVMYWKHIFFFFFHFREAPITLRTAEARTHAYEWFTYPET